MKDVVGLTSIVQAKHGRFYKTTYIVQYFNFCTTYSLLSLSYHLLTVISLVIIFLANYKQVSASKAINVIEHNDCLLSLGIEILQSINIKIRPVRPLIMIDFTTKITTTFHLLPQYFYFYFVTFLFLKSTFCEDEWK